MIADISVATPAEIDTVLAANWSDQQKWAHYILSDQAIIDRGRYGQAEDDRAKARIADYKARLATLKAEAEPLEAEFQARGGWLRYFLVTNGNGHVHREMSCTTCYPTTQFAWLPELSACDEDAMVEEWGEKACTVCFPNAPANPRFSEPSRRDQEARAQREAEKVARAAAKAEKAINAQGSLKVPYGTSTDRRTGLEVTDYREVRTKVAARNALSEAVQSYGFYGPTHPYRFQDAIVVLVEALDAVGFDTAKVIDTAARKALKDGANHDYRKVMA